MNRLTTKPVAIVADHRAVALKAHLKDWLRAQGFAVNDLGAEETDGRVDAMDYAVALAGELKSARSDFAVGLCGSGQMIAMAANRFPFVRATLLHTVEEARGARQHGDANLLALGADLVDAATAEAMLGVFLTTEPLGERYAERRERLARLDISQA